MRNLLLIFTLLMIGCEGGPSGVAGGTGGGTTPTTESTPEETPEGSTNNLPVTTSGSVTTAFNTTVSVSLTATDSDSDSLTYYLVNQPAHGDITCTEQTCSFVPDTGYSGTDSFTFLVNDGTGDSNTSTVSLSIGTNPDSCSETQNPFSITTNYVKNSSGVLTGAGGRLLTCTGSYLIPSLIYDSADFEVINGVQLRYTSPSGTFNVCYRKTVDDYEGRNRFIRATVEGTTSCTTIAMSLTQAYNYEQILDIPTYLNLVKDSSVIVTKF